MEDVSLDLPKSDGLEEDLEDLNQDESFRPGSEQREKRV